MSLYTDAAEWCRRIEGLVYQVEAPLVWMVGHRESDLPFIVPAGAHFDVSIPRPLRRLIDPHDKRLLKAAALHDEMLRRGWSRVTAGAEFHEALRADRVRPALRLAMWLAVSLYKWR